MNERDRKADLSKLADAFFDHLERKQRCEYGGWGLDDKRPFGNSFVRGNILEIIGWKEEGEDDDWTDEQLQYAEALYDELGEFLRSEWKRMRNRIATCTCGLGGER